MITAAAGWSLVLIRCPTWECPGLRPRSCPLKLLLQVGQWGRVQPWSAFWPMPTPYQGLVSSACCQVLSVFFPEASNCFLKKPDPRAQTKAGAAKGETPFSPPVPPPVPPQ